MNRRLIGTYASLAVATPLAIVFGRIYVAAHGDFGRDDLPAFAFWSVVLLLPLALGFRLVAPWLAPRGPLVKTITGAVAGFLLGIAFTLALARGMGPWIGAFGLPILWFWAFAAAASSGLASLFLPNAPVERLVRTMLWRALGLALGLGLVVAAPTLDMLGSAFLWGRAQLETYFVPSGFEGPVLVIYDQASAPALPIVNGGRRLDIPASGVLVTSSSRSEGWKDPAIYLIGRDGAQTPVATDWSRSGTKEDHVRTYWLGTRIAGTVNGVPQPDMSYEAFILGPPGQDARFEARADSMLDSLWAIYAH